MFCFFVIIERMSSFDTSDIIYALSTPMSKGAIGVIRVSGKSCLSKIEPFFKSSIKLSKAESNSVVYGKLAKLDNCLISVFKDGHGYTGEESLEISCHGGLNVINSILEFLSSLGLRQAERGEFTLRAFLNGKMDLTRAEAVNELINSKSDVSAEMALNRLNGELFRKIKKMTDVVADVLSEVEFQLDYTDEDDLDSVSFDEDKILKTDAQICDLIKSYDVAHLYSDEVKIVICGCTNAGKSSLFNYLLKEERSIVSAVEGTTRDYIEASCTISDIPVRIFDTAGLRETSDDIEKEGVRRSRLLINNADVILYLLAAEDAVSDSELLNDKRTILIKTKSDLKKKYNLTYDGICFSTVTGEGFRDLCKAIREKVSGFSQSFNPDDRLFIQSSRQKVNLINAHENLMRAVDGFRKGLGYDLLALDLREALDNLGEITGAVTSDDILDKIFSEFCVGK